MIDLYDAQIKKIPSKPTYYNGDHCAKVIFEFLKNNKYTGIEIFYLGNIIKYLYRAQAAEDFDKAIEYIKMLKKEFCDEQVSYKDVDNAVHVPNQSLRSGCV